MTVEKVRNLASSLSELKSHRAFCLFGSREKIEASELELTIVELLG